MYVRIYSICMVCTQYYYSVLYKPGCSVINQGCILLVMISSKYAGYTLLSVMIFWEKLSKGFFNHGNRSKQFPLRTKRWLSAAPPLSHEPFTVQHFYGSVAPVQLCRCVPLLHISGQFDKHYHRTQHASRVYTRKTASSSMNCYGVANGLWLINDDVPPERSTFLCMYASVADSWGWDALKALVREDSRLALTLAFS